LYKPSLIIGSKQAFAAENLTRAGWEIGLFLQGGDPAWPCEPHQYAKSVLASDACLGIDKEIKPRSIGCAGCMSFVCVELLFSVWVATASAKIEHCS